MPTATGPAKHLFRQIEKKLEQLMIEYADYFHTFTTIELLSTLKVPIRHTFPIRNTVLNKCMGGDFMNLIQ